MVKPLAAVDTFVQVYTDGSYQSLYGQRDGTLTLSMDVYELKHKTAGRWINRVAGYRDWKLECDALTFMTDGDDFHSTWRALIDAWGGDVEDANLQVQMLFPGGMTASGYVLMTDLPLGVPDGASTIKASFVANGALTFA